MEAQKTYINSELHVYNSLPPPSPFFLPEVSGVFSLISHLQVTHDFLFLLFFCVCCNNSVSLFGGEKKLLAVPRCKA